jgi:hydroxymethylpyrimidine/phosphomethylpyrimidine kinase
MIPDTVIRDLKDIKEKIAKTNNLPPIIPQEGISLAYAHVSARGSDSVEVLYEGEINTGVDLPVVRMALTAMRFDPDIRSVGVIRYSPQALSACTMILLDICSFDRSREPPGGTTIDFGVAFCCEKINGVPDIIYDTGAPGKEGLIRILGENPTLVSGSINRIVTRIMNTNPVEE